MGGIMTSRGPLRLNRYASGGVARGAQMAIFGEGSGPEAYVPLPDGRAIPVNINGARGGATHVVAPNITIHNNIPAGMSAEDTNRTAATFARKTSEMIRQSVNEAIIAQMRTGGLLNPA